MILSINKPKGMSSYDVIRILKRQNPKETKIGHGGTLDPQAQGVLIVAVGRESTRQLQNVLKNTTKEYVADIILGKVSQTDDSEGPITDGPSQRQPDLDEVKTALPSFVGDIEQTPPIYSAIKIKGQPAYKRARRGEELTIKPKKVTIHEIELIGYEYPMLTIKVVCGSGVYIRSLARDIGAKLGTGAYMSDLVRTKVGSYSIERAVSLGGLTHL